MKVILAEIDMRMLLVVSRLEQLAGIKGDNLDGNHKVVAVDNR